MSELIFKMKNVSFQYDQKTVLQNIDFSITKGAFVGLVGPNGSGKTTLIKLLLGILKPQSGSIELFGTPIQKFKKWDRIGFVSQKANSFNKGFPATVFEVVSMGLTARVGYFKFMNQKQKSEIKEAIKQVGLQDYTDQNVGDLSGGQQQRVFIARALVSKPDLLILDEPTVGVDVENVKRFYEMLAHLNKELNMTLLLISHDIGTMTTYATDLACLNKTLHFHGDPSDFDLLTEQDLSKIYGHPVNIVTHDH